jgi:hypothetical protein
MPMFLSVVAISLFILIHTHEFGSNVVCSDEATCITSVELAFSSQTCTQNDYYVSQSIGNQGSIAAMISSNITLTSIQLTLINRKILPIPCTISRSFTEFQVYRPIIIIHYKYRIQSA